MTAKHPTWIRTVGHCTRRSHRHRTCAHHDSVNRVSCGSNIPSIQSCLVDPQDLPRFESGFYMLLRSAYVARDANNFAPDDDELVAELKQGEDAFLSMAMEFFSGLFCALQQGMCFSCTPSHPGSRGVRGG